MAVGTRRGGLAAKLVLCCSALGAVGLLGAGPAAAAPPANDNFANAQTISGQLTSSNVQATKQTGEPNHADDPGGASVWYSWTAPSTGNFAVTTCGSQFDTLLGVYTGSAVNALTEVASNDEGFRCSSDGSDHQSDLVFHATSGVNYKIAVDGYSAGGGTADTGNFLLSVSADTTPSNDNFSTPKVEGEPNVDGWTEFGRNLSASKQTGEPNHAGNAGGASLWYSWTAPQSGHYQLDTCNTEVDTVLAVYTGSAVNSLTPIASDHDSCGFGSIVDLDAVGGTVYRIAVDGFDGARGDFWLAARKTNPPSNDKFVNAQTISGTNAHVTGTNIDATSEPGEPTGFVDGPLSSVWYSWTAPVSGQATMDACASDFDTVLTVFTGNALNALTRVTSNDDAPNCGFGGSRLILNVNGGTTYRIAVDGYFEQGDIDLKLVLNPGPTVAQKDSSAPNSKIKKVVVDSEHGKAKVTFSSSEAGSKYKCKLDKAKYKSCHSPKTFRHLDEGKHKVKVVATDAAGNTDPTAAVEKFKIDG
jgi:hypothetical protein